LDQRARKGFERLESRISSESRLQTLGGFADNQSSPNASIDLITSSLPRATGYLGTSRLTDLEFTHSPSQISLAAWYLASGELVVSYIDWKYTSDNGDEPMTEEDGREMPFGSAKDRLMGIIKEVADIIKSAEGEMDIKKVKEVDKRLKGCTNPEKVPGSALSVNYIRGNEVAS
jgi:cyclin H